MNTNDMRLIPMAEWGRDHWSLLGYIETRCVDYRGTLDVVHMRCNIKRHPGVARDQHLSIRKDPGYQYPTRLRGNTAETPRVESEHDDWDCFEDLEREGVVINIGTGLHPAARLTTFGKALAAQLRAHKTQKGNTFSNFIPHLDSLPLREPLPTRSVAEVMSDLGVG